MCGVLDRVSPGGSGETVGVGVRGFELSQLYPVPLDTLTDGRDEVSWGT